jgi:hypothetical protein
MVIIVFMPRPLKVQKRRLVGMVISLIARAPTRGAAPAKTMLPYSEKPPTVTALAEMGKVERPKSFIKATSSARLR